MRIWGYDGLVQHISPHPFLFRIVSLFTLGNEYHALTEFVAYAAEQLELSCRHKYRGERIKRLASQ